MYMDIFIIMEDFVMMCSPFLKSCKKYSIAVYYPSTLFSLFFALFLIKLSKYRNDTKSVQKKAPAKNAGAFRNVSQ